MTQSKNLLVSEVPAEAYNIIKHAQFKLFGYMPHEAQQKIHQSTAQFVVAVCGRRFGKSFFAANEIAALAFNPAFKDTRSWVVAPHHSLTEKVFRDVIKIATLNGFLPYFKVFNNSDKKRYIKTLWGSEIECKTADNEKSLVGDELDLLIIDEGSKLKESAWDQHLLPTLADRKGRVFIITTPQGKDWVYRLYERGQEKNDPDFESFNFASRENPHKYVRDFMEKAKRVMSPLKYQQEFLASFVSFEGAVYSEFTFTDHVIEGKPEEFKDFDYIVYGLDYGHTNPTAILVIGVHDGKHYILDEVYKTGMLLGDITRELEVLQKKYGKGVLYPDNNYPAYNKELSNKGFRVMKIWKDVIPGIEAVTSALKTGNLFITQKCKNTIKEFESYRYHQDKQGSNNKEEPIKENDHALDALRYAIYSMKKTFKPKTLKGAWL